MYKKPPLIKITSNAFSLSNLLLVHLLKEKKKSRKMLRTQFIFLFWLTLLSFLKHEVDSRSTAALIVGGFLDHDFNLLATTGVELVRMRQQRGL